MINSYRTSLPSVGLKNAFMSYVYSVTEMWKELSFFPPYSVLRLALFNAESKYRNQLSLFNCVRHRHSNSVIWKVEELKDRHWIASTDALVLKYWSSSNEWKVLIHEGLIHKHWVPGSDSYAMIHRLWITKLNSQSLIHRYWFTDS